MGIWLRETELSCPKLPWKHGQVFHWRTVRYFLASPLTFLQIICTHLLNDSFIYSFDQHTSSSEAMCGAREMMENKKTLLTSHESLLLWWGTQVNNQARPTHCDRCYERRKCATEAQGGHRNKCHSMCVWEGFLEEVTSKLRPEEMKSIVIGWGWKEWFSGRTENVLRLEGWISESSGWLQRIQMWLRWDIQGGVA